MKTQHTPGPWFANDKYIEDQHGTIAKVMRPEDNSALIAAAPELLDMLEMVHAMLDRPDCERNEYRVKLLVENAINKVKRGV